MNNKKELLILARKAINTRFGKKGLIVNGKIKKQFAKKQPCFVTLTENDELRGCIGSLQAHKSLYQDIIDNAQNAAFRDPRFPPLTKEELSKTRIEVSILSEMKKIDFKTPEELLSKINNKMGIYLKKDLHSATFLPQVWSQINNKIEFLEHLSMKAGLSKDSWKTSEIYFYKVKKIKEK